MPTKRALFHSLTRARLLIQIKDSGCRQCAANSLWRTPLKQGQHDGDVPRTAPIIALAAYHSTAYLAKGKLTLPVLAIGGEAAFGTMMATVMHFAAIDV